MSYEISLITCFGQNKKRNKWNKSKRKHRNYIIIFKKNKIKKIYLNYLHECVSFSSSCSPHILVKILYSSSAASKTWECATLYPQSKINLVFWTYRRQVKIMCENVQIYCSYIYYLKC